MTQRKQRSRSFVVSSLKGYRLLAFARIALVTKFPAIALATFGSTGDVILLLQLDSVSFKSDSEREFLRLTGLLLKSDLLSVFDRVMMFMPTGCSPDMRLPLEKSCN